MINLILMLVPCLVAQQSSSDPQRMLLSAINDAFSSNQASFPFADIKFEYIQGSANSPKEARTGEFTPRYVANGIYVFDHKMARYERAFSEDEMRQSSKFLGNQVTSILDTFRLATDGERTLYESVSANSTVTDLLCPAASDLLS